MPDFERLDFALFPGCARVRMATGNFKGAYLYTIFSDTTYKGRIGEPKIYIEDGEGEVFSMRVGSTRILRSPIASHLLGMQRDLRRTPDMVPMCMRPIKNYTCKVDLETRWTFPGRTTLSLYLISCTREEIEIAERMKFLGANDE